MPRPPLSALGLALLLALPALAQQAPETSPRKEGEAAAAAKPVAPAAKAGNEKLDRVEVTGGPDADAARRASTASKTIIGRDELLRYGDSSIAETMKRLPGVTTGGVAGRGGDIRMRGMAGGYTQILVNGERMPPGFSLDTLPPEQVERIEVMRAPTAETGARAIAGTINVVLRDAPPKRANELRLGLGYENDNWLPSFNLSRNDKLDDEGKLTYNITVNAQQFERSDESSGVGSTRDLRIGLASYAANRASNQNQNRSLNLNGRLQWRPANGEMLSIMPFVATGKGHGGFASQRLPGAVLLPEDAANPNQYDASSGAFANEFSAARLMGTWQTKVGGDGKLDSSAAIGRFSNKSSNSREETLEGKHVRSRADTADSRNSNWSLRSKFSKPVMEEHSLVSGIELERTRLSQTRACLEEGLPCGYLLDFGDDIDAGTRRFAAYAQDEWNVGKQWSFYAGLRWEAIDTDSRTRNYNVSNASRVVTPLLHGLYRFSDDPKKSRDQIRLSLTRSYRSPDLNDLIARPVPSTLKPCPSGGKCTESNEYLYADFAGNPKLKPELATGVDLAYEQYLSKGGVLSANVFVRRIENLMRRGVEFEQQVDWSTAPRWVSRPRNIGTALSSGLELEAKFRLDQFIADVLPINMRTNLSLFRSRVDGIEGPHNRLAQQPRFTANIGGDYRLKSLPLNLGASMNYTPDVTLRQNAQLVTSNSKKRVFDAFAAWTVDMNTVVRLSAANLGAQDYSNSSQTVIPEKIASGVTTGKTYTQWALRLEMKV